MPMTEAQKRAKRKYINKTYSNLQVKLKKAEFFAIDEYCNLHNISKSRFIFWACNYFMMRGELPPESEVILDNDDSVTS